MQRRTEASQALISTLAPVLAELCDNSPKYGFIRLSAEFHDGQLVSLEAGNKTKFKATPNTTTLSGPGGRSGGAK